MRKLVHTLRSRRKRESSFRLFWFFCYNQCRDYRRVIKHGRTEIVLCFPQRRNERARRGLKMWENLLFRLVGGTPDDFVDKVMWYGWPNVFTRQMNAARLVSRDLRVVRAQTRHIRGFQRNVCTLYTICGLYLFSCNRFFSRLVFSIGVQHCSRG